MNYAAQSQRPNPAAMIGALGVPAAFGALLVAGLAVTAVVKNEPDRLKGVIIEPTPIDPPPLPEPSTPTESSSAPQTQTPQVITQPDAPIVLGPDPIIATGPMTLPPGNLTIPTGPIELGITPLPPLPDPIAASPRNAPGGWISDRDYKSRWIREGREGKARFRLEISASGRVSDCVVVGSTGHSELDLATCRLITLRARFDPAKDSSGNPVPGKYRSAVNWQIPK